MSDIPTILNTSLTINETIEIKKTIVLLHQHHIDHKVLIEDMAGTVSDLIQESNLKLFEMFNDDVNNIRRAHAGQFVSILQSEYSLW